MFRTMLLTLTNRKISREMAAVRQRTGEPVSCWTALERDNMRRGIAGKKGASAGLAASTGEQPLNNQGETKPGRRVSALPKIVDGSFM